MAMPAEKARYTFADVLAWDEKERAEIIGGEVFMLATPSTDHQLISGELFAQLHAYLKGKKCKAIQAPFAVRLFEQDGDSLDGVDTVVEPDITVVCDRDKLDSKGCKGAPDMVVEILSPSTQRHDRLTKFNLYQRAGVREYWIVDPAERLVWVYTLEEDGFYHTATVYSAGSVQPTVPVGILEGCEIDLTTVFPEGRE